MKLKTFLLSILMVLVLCTSAWATALNSTVIWETRADATAGNVNGGAFDPAVAGGLTDMTATLANTAAPVIASISDSCVAGDVGAWIYVTSGTGWTRGWYKISSCSGASWVIDATAGNAVLATPAAPALTLSTSGTLCSDATCGGNNGTGSIDFSQKTSSAYAYTDLASTSGSSFLTITSAHAGFRKSMQGNMIHITTTGTGAHFTIGWYMVTAVASTTSATVHSACGTSSDASTGTFAIGGASSFNTTTTSMADINLAAALVAGNTMYFNATGGALTAKGTSGITWTTGTTTALTSVVGYKTYRPIVPIGTDRPAITTGGAGGFFTGAVVAFKNLILSTLASDTVGYVMSAASNGLIIENCKIFYGNSSATGKTGLMCSSSACKVINSEIYAVGSDNTSIALSMGTAGAKILGSWIHGSSTGGTCISINSTVGQGGGTLTVSDSSIIGPDCTNGINITAVNSDLSISGSTFFGPTAATAAASTPQGTAINVGAVATDRWLITNNIFFGWTTAINFNAAYKGTYSNYNAYYNNTTDIANSYIDKGANDITVGTGGNWAIFTSTPNGGPYNFALGGAYGSTLQGMGIPGTAVINGQTSRGYRDIGAIQHAIPVTCPGCATGF